MILKRILFFFTLTCLTVGCVDSRHTFDAFCIDEERIDPQVQKAVNEYIANKKNKSFVLTTASLLDFCLFYKKTCDVYVISPNYSGIIDSTQSAYVKDTTFTGCRIPHFKWTLKTSPVYHCHMKGKTVFLQSSVDDLINDQKTNEYFTESATQSSNGRNQYMRESMCIIKKPNGEVKTFIVGDSILMNDNLLEHY